MSKESFFLPCYRYQVRYTTKVGEWIEEFRFEEDADAYADKLNR